MTANQQIMTEVTRMIHRINSGERLTCPSFPNNVRIPERQYLTTNGFFDTIERCSICNTDLTTSFLVARCNKLCDSCFSGSLTTT